MSLQINSIKRKRDAALEDDENEYKQDQMKIANFCNSISSTSSISETESDSNDPESISNSDQDESNNNDELDQSDEEQASEVIEDNDNDDDNDCIRCEGERNRVTMLMYGFPDDEHQIKILNNIPHSCVPCGDIEEHAYETCSCFPDNKEVDSEVDHEDAEIN